MEGQVADGAFVPKVLATYDRGFGLPLGHSSVWLRAAGGFSPTDRTNPFANFFFGGFGNNYVDVRNEKRYREYYALPGADLNEIDGRNFAKATVEWNLPPWRFRRFGTAGFHATWLRPALFVTGLTTNLDLDSPRRLVSGGGANRRSFQPALGAGPHALGRSGGDRRVRRGAETRADGLHEDPPVIAVTLALALLPVLLFVVGLRLMDSFKLVHRGAVFTAIAVGMAGAIACAGFHEWLQPSLD